ncbi:MAG: monofunctional biosynthetic peptidoglycan transglycosylase [Deltaproteobacteria bacterium]|nr:monofunctional biosynthetic peptidoglycan transglycosylase [Deltaproteobacteria bacterium]
MKWIFGLISTFLFLVVALYFFLPIASLKTTNPGKTPFMISYGGPVAQVWVPLSQISQNLRWAVVAAEDGQFYQHQGIDFYEMRQAIKRDFRRKRYSHGFSTLTMQLAKNLYLSPEKSIFRKGLEILITFKIEKNLSKNRILELYLNVAEWAPGVFGAEAAAEHYFQKSAALLSIDEAAFLAAILPNPKRWGQWPPTPYVARRREVILARLQSHLQGPVVSPIVPAESESVPELPEEEEWSIESKH